MEFKPHAYQQYAIQKVVDQAKVGLFLDMGLGKTVVTLTAVKELLDDFAVGKVLVIAPLRVAQTVWAEEAQKWDHLTGLRVSKILGSHAERVEGLRQTADIYVINRENVAWLVAELRGRWPFDMVVIDELSSFKNRASERFKSLRRVLPCVKRLVGLTGTPAPNGLMDLWSQIYLLDQGERLGRTLTAYRDAFFTPGQRNGNIVYSWQLKPFAEEEILHRLEGLCVSMTSEHYLDLPECIYHDVPVVLGAEQTWYRDMERKQIIELAGQEITALNAAAVAGKLMQITGGAVYDEQGEYQKTGRAKLDALAEIIDSAQGKPVLVFYQFRHELPRLQAAFPKAVSLSTSADVEKWNRGEIPVLLAHPASAGHGLNLQQGGHIMVWYTMTWNLEHYEQACKRLHRQGQKHPVIIHHLIAKGTIDERIKRVLEGKATVQDAVMGAFEDAEQRA
jgi:SNF2 family DNA or RNA helicase